MLRSSLVPANFGWTFPQNIWQEGQPSRKVPRLFDFRNRKPRTKTMEVARPLILGIVSVIGVVGHVLTLFMLRGLRLTLANTSLDATTHRLVVSETWCDLLLCGIALPLSIWNRARGYVWPFTMPGACYYKRIFQASLTQVSCYHILIISVVRCIVAFSSPNSRMRKVLQNVWLKTLVSLFPWIIGYVSTVVGYASSAYRFAYSFFTNNNCDLMPTGFSKEAINKVMVFFAADVLCGIILPMLIAAIVSTIAWVKIVRRKRRALQRTDVTDNAGTTTVAATHAWGADNAGEPAAVTNHALQAAEVLHANATAHHFNKTLALVCFVNLVLLLPLTLAPMVGFTGATETKHPQVALLLEFLFWSSFSVIPFMYAAFSSDMRAVYVKLLKKMFCSGKSNQVEQQRNDLAMEQPVADRNEKAN